MTTLEFDRNRKMMSTLCTNKGRAVLFAKGAPESVLSRCTQVTPLLHPHSTAPAPCLWREWLASHPMIPARGRSAAHSVLLSVLLTHQLLFKCILLVKNTNTARHQFGSWLGSWSVTSQVNGAAATCLKQTSEAAWKCPSSSMQLVVSTCRLACL